MVPLGDAKGTALALMAERLCADLRRANCAFEATSFFDADSAPPGLGQSLIAIDPAARAWSQWHLALSRGFSGARADRVRGGLLA